MDTLSLMPHWLIWLVTLIIVPVLVICIVHSLAFPKCIRCHAKMTLLDYLFAVVTGKGINSFCPQCRGTLRKRALSHVTIS